VVWIRMPPSRSSSSVSSPVGHVMRLTLILLVSASCGGCVSYDYTRGTPSVCDVHQIQMVRTRVDAYPGIIGRSYVGTPYPNAYRPVWSRSCEVRTTNAFTWVCSGCDRAWREAGHGYKR
jgi:hypothetical protein